MCNFIYKILIVVFSVLIVRGSLVENFLNEIDHDYKCDFEDMMIAETVRFVRSPFSCRVYHVCAFYKQYTLTCAEGLYFDLNLDSCNFQNLVDCQLKSTEQIDATTSTVSNNFTEFKNINDLSINNETNETFNKFQFNFTNFAEFNSTESNINITTLETLRSTILPLETTTFIILNSTLNEINNNISEILAENLTISVNSIFNQSEILETYNSTLSPVSSASLIQELNLTNTEPTEEFSTIKSTVTVPSISIPLVYKENSDLSSRICVNFLIVY